MLELLNVDFEDYEQWGELYRQYTHRNASPHEFQKCSCGCGERCLDGGHFIQGHKPQIPAGALNVPHPNGQGAKNHMWKGGISFKPYCFKFNNSFKESIRNEFNRVCFLCGKSEIDNNQRLSVHHVNYDKNCLCNDSICSFVPLCVSCHSKTNNDRKYWENYLMELIKMKSRLIVEQEGTHGIRLTKV